MSPIDIFKNKRNTEQTKSSLKLFVPNKKSKVAFTLAEIFSTPFKNNRKYAFTLAEVLITLGIVGIVAALILPHVISNLNKRIIESKLKKTYTDLANLMRLAETEKGEFKNWDFTLPNQDFVSEYFMPYTSLTLCDRYNAGKNKYDKHCFIELGAYSVWRLQPDGRFETGGLYGVMPKYKWNGRYIGITPSYDSTRNVYRIMFVVDVDGNRGSTTMGQDVFGFSYEDFSDSGYWKGISFGNRLQLSVVEFYSGAVSYDASTDKIKEKCVEQKGYSCGILIQRNNFKIPDDYPIKF